LPDGTGVINSTNSLNGDIISNDNFGNLYLIDPSAGSITLIGNNPNERGDFVNPDPTTGTVLLDYSDEVERLSCGPSCAFVPAPVPTPVPEPASLALLGTGFCAFAFIWRRQRQSASSKRVL
jgi:hypothetical protein